jgi:hypothetical protein
MKRCVVDEIPTPGHLESYNQNTTDKKTTAAILGEAETEPHEWKEGAD